jgi:hypothetical protein
MGTTDGKEETFKRVGKVSCVQKKMLTAWYNGNEIMGPHKSSNCLQPQVTGDSKKLNLLEKARMFHDRECLAKKQREKDMEREQEQPAVNQWVIKETMKPTRKKRKEPSTTTIISPKIRTGKLSKDTKNNPNNTGESGVVT